jgi:hypothetical protein
MNCSTRSKLEIYAFRNEGDGKPIMLSEMKEMVKITEKVTRRRISRSLQELQWNCEGHTR